MELVVCALFNQYMEYWKGQLGHGDTIQRDRPTIISELSKYNIIKAGGGKAHTVVVTEDGLSLAFGWNKQGQLGIGSAKNGYVKEVIERKTGVEPSRQKILFRGKEKEDWELLHEAGVKDKLKLLVLESKWSNEKKPEEVKESEES